jgi:sodium transport system permease protein
LLHDNAFTLDYCPEEEAQLLHLTVTEALPVDVRGQSVQHVAQEAIRQGTYDAVIYFPPDFAARMAEFVASVQARGESAARAAGQPAPLVPQPEIFVNSANDKSRMAAGRVDVVLARWRDDVVRGILVASRVSPVAVKPFGVSRTDVSEETLRHAAVWAKLLPFIVVIWALTGAFYPAIDLCPGEKERGTLETLLSSPARRSEIVAGKLLTVMSFSAASALLNLLSMGITGSLIIRQMQQMPGAGLDIDLTPPPLRAVLVLTLAAIPISALFGAVSLAIAAFARSAKEGQYYLMPVLIISLPLMLLSVAPAAELDFGTSVIPITGMMLWLRVLIEGQYVEALRFAAPVLGVTAVCCWLAVRWAVHQFESESVLFREGERFGLGIWLRHKVRDRGEVPTAAEAVLCGVLILLTTFFASLHAVQPQSWPAFIRVVFVTQIGLIVAPALIMTAMLTRNPRGTLLLTKPRLLAVPAAFVLALCLHPLILLLGRGVEATYPLSDDTLRTLQQLTAAMHNAPLWQILAVVALTPAVCEELTFRGFILSGLKNLDSKWSAIAISSLFFGLTHGLLQQSLTAAAVGMVLGYIAVETGSLLPGVIYHLTHNSLSMIVGRITPEMLEQHAWLGRLLHPTDTRVVPYSYHWPVVLVGAAIALGLLFWVRRSGKASKLQSPRVAEFQSSQPK